MCKCADEKTTSLNEKIERYLLAKGRKPSSFAHLHICTSAHLFSHKRNGSFFYNGLAQVGGAYSNIYIYIGALRYAFDPSIPSFPGLACFKYLLAPAVEYFKAL